jgi:serine/threonine protein kinase
MIYEIGQEHGDYFIAMEVIRRRVSRPVSCPITDWIYRNCWIWRFKFQMRSTPLTQVVFCIAISSRQTFSSLRAVRQRFSISDWQSWWPLARALPSRAMQATRSWSLRHIWLSCRPNRPGARTLTRARTLFSFGAVLYGMATGKLPFDGETTAVVFDAIVNRDSLPVRDLNAELPPRVDEIIRTALEKDRDLRYQSGG